MTRAGEERFTVLDGLRGMAALVVITDHVHSPTLEALLPGRYLAVDFFFALSGFVLAHVYGARLGEGAMAPRRFLSVRLIRLMPLYLLAIVAASALATIAALKGWGDAAPLPHIVWSTVFGVVLLPCPPPLSIWPNAPFPLDGPAWSLFFELVANILFALFIRRLSVRVLAVVLIANAVLLAMTAFALGKLDSGFAWSNFSGGFFRVGYGFFAGVLIYRLRGFWRAPVLPVWMAFPLLFAVFAAPAHGVWRPVFDIGAATILLPALVTTASGAQVRGVAAWVCASLGALSYGFYILQVPTRDWLQIILQHMYGEGRTLSGAADVMLVAGVTIAVVAVLDFVYDRPVRAWLSSRRVKGALKPG